MSPVALLFVAAWALPAGQPGPTTPEAIIRALGRPANFAGDLNDTPLLDLLKALTRQHGIPFVIQVEYFLAENVNDIKEKKPALAATDLKGLSLREFLTVTLDSVNAAYMIKGGRIEVVPPNYARGATRRIPDDAYTPPAPLLSVIVKQKPLKDVVASVAEEHDLSVVVSPKVGDAMDAPVTARLLNVPADQILDRLVVACDLRAVRRGGSFLITTPEHAKQLAAEQLERARQKAELDAIRNVPLWFPPNLGGLPGCFHPPPPRR